MSNVITEAEAKSNVSANVQRLLDDREWSQSDLARAAKTNTMAISRICRGTNEPTAALLANIAESLGVSVDSLLAEPPKRNSRRVG